MPPDAAISALTAASAAVSPLAMACRFLLWRRWCLLMSALVALLEIDLDRFKIGGRPAARLFGPFFFFKAMIEF
jgi:hypothetical protein